jgi:hypothetical protein
MMMHARPERRLRDRDITARGDESFEPPKHFLRNLDATGPGNFRNVDSTSLLICWKRTGTGLTNQARYGMDASRRIMSVHQKV